MSNRRKRVNDSGEEQVALWPPASLPKPPAKSSSLFGIVGGAANLSGCQSLVVEGVADHLHALFVLPRSTCVSDALRGIKSASSNWISALNSRLHIIRGIPSRMNCVNCFAAMALRGTKNMFGIDALTKRPPAIPACQASS